MTTVLVLTPDLLFSTRIRSTLARAGYDVHLGEQADAVALDTALAARPPVLVILDIGAAGAWPWPEALRHLRSEYPDLPVLAFGSHMDVEATQRAQRLGATRVVARSEFVNKMAALVERYARPDPT